MDLLEVLKSRYSVRNFKEEKIKKEDLDKILEAGRIAPTAKNIQPIKIIVAETKQAIDKLNVLSKCIYGANTVLIVCYDKSLVWVNKRRGDYNTGEVDAAIVATHMMLEAHSINVGSVMVGMFSDVEVKEAFNLDSNLVPVLLMPLGYPSSDSKPNEDFHYPKKAIEEIVDFI